MLGYALTPRSLWLLTAGVLFAIPSFFVPHTLWMMPAWDAVVFLLAVWDAARLPAPSVIRVERRLANAPSLGHRTDVVLGITQSSGTVMRMWVMDGLHPALRVLPRFARATVYPDQMEEIRDETFPSQRGELTLDRVYLRYRSAIGLAERWATAPVEQRIVVIPNAVGATDDAMYLIRARQIEVEKRRLGRIGLGREFESLRDYRDGDELRNISWTATARQSKPITRTFRAERSQQVWMVVDAGRLSRTSFERPLSRSAEAASGAGGFEERMLDGRLHLQQLDQAASAAMRLSQVIDGAGDRSGLLAYGRGIQQQIRPAKGPLHLRRILDALAVIRAETAEADHRLAAARLRQMQSRRSLIFWITEIAESASAPEVSLAVAELARNHLVVLVLLEHPELGVFAQSQAGNVAEMFAVTAANEMLARRRMVVAQLRRRGVLVLETSPENAGVAAINRYLEIKARGTL